MDKDKQLSDKDWKKVQDRMYQQQFPDDPLPEEEPIKEEGIITEEEVEEVLDPGMDHTTSKDEAKAEDKNEKPGKLKRKLSLKITTDPALNIVRPGPDMKISGDFNYRVKQMHDVFYHKLSLWCRDNPKKATLFLFQYKSLEKLLGIHIDELLTLLPPIIFTDSEFREITGLHHLSGKEIKEIAKQYSKIRLDGVFYVADDGKKWREYSIHSHIAGIVIEESGDYSKRGNKPIWTYCIGWNLLTYLLFHNLLHERYTLFKKEFYKLEAGCQEIYRKIAQFKKSKFRFQEMSEIIGYDKPVEKLTKQHVYLRIKQIERFLQRLMEEGFLHSWKKAPGKKGRETVFIIHRIKPKNS